MPSKVGGFGLGTAVVTFEFADIFNLGLLELEQFYFMAFLAAGIKLELFECELFLDKLRIGSSKSGTANKLLL